MISKENVIEFQKKWGEGIIIISNSFKSGDDYLAQAGTDKSKLLTAQIWLDDIRKFDEMNVAWDAWLSPGNAPTRACVESRMANPGIFVEILVTAAID